MFQIPENFRPHFSPPSRESASSLYRLRTRPVAPLAWDETPATRLRWRRAAGNHFRHFVGGIEDIPAVGVFWSPGNPTGRFYRDLEKQ